MKGILVALRAPWLEAVVIILLGLRVSMCVNGSNSHKQIPETHQHPLQVRGPVSKTWPHSLCHPGLTTYMLHHEPHYRSFFFFGSELLWYKAWTR